MRKLLRERQIDWLFHFTRAENLFNIFRYGLIPIEILKRRGISVVNNDHIRYDNCDNAICTTIEFPNYKMFYSLRLDNPGVKWAVLRLRADIICDFECAFCTENAGSATMFTMSIEKRQGKEAFLKMFEELPNGPTRNELGLGDWYTTNPQAEVLVFGEVPIEYIDCVYFETRADLNEYEDIIPEEIEAAVNRELFFGRKDWKKWQ